VRPRCPHGADDLVAREPDDNPVVACALEAGARFVVTDDRKHLLPIKALRVGVPDRPDRELGRVPALPSLMRPFGLCP
jgi:hypothetical protein